MSYKYIGVPQNISFRECCENDSVFAPSKYSRFLPHNDSLFVPLSSVCQESKSKISFNKKEMYAYSEIGDIDVTNGTVNHHCYYGINLPSDNPKQCKSGDILVSTVRTYRGGIGVVSDNLKNHCCSPAILIIRDITDKRINKEYLLAVLRTDFFTEQILGLQTRGMYPRLDSDAMKKVFIPVPKDEKVIRFISLISKAYINKYNLIRQRHNTIIQLIEKELMGNQKNTMYSYKYPQINDIMEIGRLDSGLYNKEFNYWNHLVKNYEKGSVNLIERGFTYTRGTSLEQNYIKTRIDSDTYVKGFYELVLPTNISEYGYVEKSTYIGTPTILKTIKKGDIIFGGEGFGKGRTFVVIEESRNVATNYHGIRIINTHENIEESIFIRCFLAFWREKGMIDYIGVGGSGGHCSPSYFNMIETPLFPSSKQKEIATLYYNSQNYNIGEFTMDNFEEKDKQFNNKAGIYELDKTARMLKQMLDKAIDNLINNKDVVTSFNCLYDAIESGE